MKSIVSNWNVIRVIRLVLGVFVVVQGVRSHEMLYVLFGGLFVWMAVMNTGCCGPAGCSIDTRAKTTTPGKEISFEEVKEIK